MIIGLYSIDLYQNFNFGPPLSTSFSRFSKCTVKGCYLEGTFWISSNLYKSANFCLKLEKKVSKCSYVQVKIEWIKIFFKNIFSLGCPKKNVKNTKMQFKKIYPPQIDQISGQVAENFMGNILEKKNSVSFPNWGIYGIFETPCFSMKFLNCSHLIIFTIILVIFFLQA